jgi:membrane associated rhomboid family serine protease
MGISDREYVRIGPRSTSGLGSVRFISFNTWLIVVNSAVFVLQVILPRKQVVLGQTPMGAMDPLTLYGHFSTGLAFFHLEVWRFVTFQFLHANLTHVFFNMFGLWIFGGMVESYLGFKRYAAFYLVCGICGALCYLVLNFLGGMVGAQLPGVLFSDLYTPLIGASAGVFGVIVACAFIAPNTTVQLLFPPIPLKMSWFAYGYVAIAAANLLRNGQNAGGDAAHVGGAIAGFFFVRNAHLLTDFFDVFGDSRKGRGRRRAGVDPLEVDRILHKVRTNGLMSLNDRERQTLRRATEQGRRA